MRKIKFTQKTKSEIKVFERVLRLWLSSSDMTRPELLEFKTAERIFVRHEPEGQRLMCIKDGQEMQIGCGLHHESMEVSDVLFMYIGALLDSENDFKTCFSKEIIKTLKKRGE